MALKQKQKKILVVMAIVFVFSLLYLMFIEPLITKLFQTIPVFASNIRGVAIGMEQIKEFIFSDLFTLVGFTQMEWTSLEAIPGYILLVIFIFVIASPLYRSTPVHNEIIAKQPAWTGTNEHGNGGWLMTEKDIAKGTGLTFVAKDKLQTLKEGGLYVGMVGDKLCFSTEDMHAVIMAPTRLGKTFRYLLFMIVFLLQCGESVCVFDPKCEIYPLLAPYLRKLGFPINRIDYARPDNGNRANPFYRAIQFYEGTHEMFKELDKLYAQGFNDETRDQIIDIEEKLDNKLNKADLEIKRIINIIFPRDREKEGNARFFNDGAENSMMMAAHLVCASIVCPDSAKTIKTISDLLGEFCTIVPLNPSNSRDKRIFSPMLEEAHKLPIRHPAYHYMKLIESSSENIRDFVGTAQGILSNFSSTAVGRMMSANDYAFEDLCKQPTATFIMIPSSAPMYKQLSQLYIDQLYNTLVEMAQEQGGRLKRRMNIICEELATISPLNNLSDRLSYSLGLGIRWVLVLQSLTQLRSKYGKNDADSILENCGLQIYMRANTPETAEYMSSKSSDYTIEQSNTSASKAAGSFMDDRYNTTVSRTARKRLMPSEAMKWDPDQGSIVSITGCEFACILAPQIYNTEYNKEFGLGDKEFNKKLSQNELKKKVHHERVRLPYWSLELNTKELASKEWTDEERKARRAQYIASLQKRSLRRQNYELSIKNGQSKNQAKGSSSNNASSRSKQENKQPSAKQRSSNTTESSIEDSVLKHM